VGGPRAPLALAGLLERVSASARERARAAAHVLDGPAGELGASVRGRAGRARESGCRRVELGHALSWVAPRNFTPAPVGAVALGTLSAAVGAAVWWMRGHMMPTAGGA